MKKAAFLDRDRVTNRKLSEGQYVTCWEEMQQAHLMGVAAPRPRSRFMNDSRMHGLSRPFVRLIPVQSESNCLQIPCDPDNSSE